MYNGRKSHQLTSTLDILVQFPAWNQQRGNSSKMYDHTVYSGDPSCGPYPLDNSRISPLRKPSPLHPLRNVKKDLSNNSSDLVYSENKKEAHLTELSRSRDILILIELSTQQYQSYNLHVSANDKTISCSQLCLQRRRFSSDFRKLHNIPTLFTYENWKHIDSGLRIAIWKSLSLAKWQLLQ